MIIGLASALQTIGYTTKMKYPVAVLNPSISEVYRSSFILHIPWKWDTMVHTVRIKDNLYRTDFERSLCDMCVDEGELEFVMQGFEGYEDLNGSFDKLLAVAEEMSEVYGIDVVAAVKRDLEEYKTYIFY